MKKNILLLVIGFVLASCSPEGPSKIPGIPVNDSANEFYDFVSKNMASDDICRDYHGDPSIPMGEVVKGEKYVKSKDLIPGTFRFSDKTTGKKYLGVIYMQYQGLLQLPKLCSWEE